MERDKRERKNIQNNLNPLTLMTISYNGDGDVKKERRERTSLSSLGSTFICSRSLHVMMFTHMPCKFLLQVPIMTQKIKKENLFLKAWTILTFINFSCKGDGDQTKGEGREGEQAWALNFDLYLLKIDNYDVTISHKCHCDVERKKEGKKYERREIWESETCQASSSPLDSCRVYKVCLFFVSIVT